MLDEYEPRDWHIRKSIRIFMRKIIKGQSLKKMEANKRVH